MRSALRSTGGESAHLQRGMRRIPAATLQARQQTASKTFESPSDVQCIRRSRMTDNGWLQPISRAYGSFLYLDGVGYAAGPPAPHTADALVLRARVTPTLCERRDARSWTCTLSRGASQSGQRLVQNRSVPPTAARTSWMVWCTLLPECTRSGPGPWVVGVGFSDNKG